MLKQWPQTPGSGATSSPQTPLTDVTHQWNHGEGSGFQLRVEAHVLDSVALYNLCYLSF